MEVMNNDALLSTKEACQMIGVTSERLYQMVDDGVLPAYMIAEDLRFRVAELAGVGLTTPATV